MWHNTFDSIVTIAVLYPPWRVTTCNNNRRITPAFPLRIITWRWWPTPRLCSHLPVRCQIVPTVCQITFWLACLTLKCIFSWCYYWTLHVQQLLNSVIRACRTDTDKRGKRAQLRIVSIVCIIRIIYDQFRCTTLELCNFDAKQSNLCCFDGFCTNLCCAKADVILTGPTRTK